MGHRHPANIRVHDAPTRTERRVDRIVAVFATPRFLAWQTVFIAFWMAWNGIVAVAVLRTRPFDPFPWILLNLIFSTQAAYAAPLILFSQSRQAERDRIKAEHDYATNEMALRIALADHLDRHGPDCSCHTEPVVIDLVDSLLSDLSMKGDHANRPAADNPNPDRLVDQTGQGSR